MSKLVEEKPTPTIKRKRNKEATIKRIINKTERMIKEKGYAKTSTNHIAKAAGVSIALIYKYFPNGKPDIVQQIRKKSLLFMGITNISDNNLEAVVGSEPTPEIIREKGKRFLLAFIAYCRRYAFLDNALEIAYLEKKDKEKLLINDEKQKLEDINYDTWDYDDFYQPYYDAVSRVLIQIGIKDKEKQIKISKLLVNTFISLIRQQVNYENLVDNDEELADFLIDLLEGYVTLRQDILSLSIDEKHT